MNEAETQISKLPAHKKHIQSYNCRQVQKNLGAV